MLGPAGMPLVAFCLREPRVSLVEGGRDMSPTVVGLSSTAHSLEAPAA